MTELSTRCLDTFPEWLRTLGADASDLAQALSSANLSEGARRYVAGGLTYLLKSLDLIPDGIEDLGFLDDAFVLRVASALAVAETPAVTGASPTLGRLASEAPLVSDLLGADYVRLEDYVRALRTGAARGRTVDEILDDEQIRGAFLGEVDGWASSYAPPGFTRDEKNLVKLRAFLSAKLPPS